MTTAHRLGPDDLAGLARFDTPTIHNGWEQITRRNSARECINLEPITDFMPHRGAMVGYAVTVVCQPGDRSQADPAAWAAYRRHVAEQPGPKIVVLQDLDKPIAYGAFWGEVNANVHLSLGCIGAIVDGAVRDLAQADAAGFRFLARCTSVSHAAATPLRWGCPVQAFGCTVQPGQLIHADRHGFLAVPDEDVDGLLEAARFMDDLEVRTKIAAAKPRAGRSVLDALADIDAANVVYRREARARFTRDGEG